MIVMHLQVDHLNRVELVNKIIYNSYFVLGWHMRLRGICLQA